MHSGRTQALPVQRIPELLSQSQNLRQVMMEQGVRSLEQSRRQSQMEEQEVRSLAQRTAGSRRQSHLM